jgi:hypothetical protein
VATGLLALLDDVAVIAKVAAASLDDTAAAAVKASAKAAGVIIDDAAVTPRYVQGFAPARELPIVGKIALGSVRNKLLFLLPGALLLSYFLPIAITPLLMLGGAYLCFEGAEKILEKLLGITAAPVAAAGADAGALEDKMVSGAIRTDLILSAEIMAITLASVADVSIVEQAAVLAAVGLFITAVVYGAVALIVKADDAGLALARTGSAPLRAIGRAMVVGMPTLLKALAVIGTAAMLWVGGGIILHGMEGYGLVEPAHSINAIAEPLGPLLGWAVGALGAGVFGLVVGGAIAGVLHFVPRKDGH